VLCRPIAALGLLVVADEFPAGVLGFRLGLDCLAEGDSLVLFGGRNVDFHRAGVSIALAIFTEFLDFHRVRHESFSLSIDV